MKHLIFLLFTTLALSLSLSAQTTPAPTADAKPAVQTEKTTKPVFRATKEQITQAQKMLKTAETGRMDDAFREEVKKYQTANALRPTGSLNRATLEKMGIALTDRQKDIPVDPKSFASEKSAVKRGPVFRATKDQITAAQNFLKAKNLYAGEANGTLDAPTRAALKAFQESSGMKGTGTLNQATLEKMGIALTDKQKENFAKAAS